MADNQPSKNWVDDDDFDSDDNEQFGLSAAQQELDKAVTLQKKKVSKRLR